MVVSQPDDVTMFREWILFLMLVLCFATVRPLKMYMLLLLLYSERVGQLAMFLFLMLLLCFATVSPLKTFMLLYFALVGQMTMFLLLLLLLSLYFATVQ